MLKHNEKDPFEMDLWNLVDIKIDSEVSKIFTGDSPFGDGELETINSSPHGFKIIQMPEGPQEFAPGLDKHLLEWGSVETTFCLPIHQSFVRA